MALKSVSVRCLRFQQRHRHELSDPYLSYPKQTNPLLEDINLKANIFSFITMEILFYPVETIVHRLHIQVNTFYTFLEISQFCHTSCILNINLIVDTFYQLLASHRIHKTLSATWKIKKHKLGIYKLKLTYFCFVC